MTEPPSAATSSAPVGLGVIGVVVPVYNEETWIRRSLSALLVEAESAGVRLDVVVVDDGSTDGTARALAQIRREHGIRIVTQANAGRLAARAAGLAALDTEWVLLLDARVEIQPGALGWVSRQIAARPERRVWSGHIDVDTDNLYATFWAALVKIGWHRYARHPRLVSFDSTDFDAYPKGTGSLLVPRRLLLEALGGFDSLYDDDNLASDDTRLLRHVASRERIWLSPDFPFRYHGKTGRRGFARQSYFRGTTFVDGYLGQPGPIRVALVGATVVGALVVAAAMWRPVVAVAAAGSVWVAAPTVVAAVGGSRREVVATAALTPVFVPTFGAGVLRGLGLAARAGLRRRAARSR